MQSTNLDLSNVVPDMFMLDEPQTGSKSILRKQFIEVNSVDRITFSPTTAKQIRIKITSPGDFMRGRESKLKFKLTMTATDPTHMHPDLFTCNFGLGGAHNLFSRVQVRTLGRGVLLQEVDYYNEFQAVEHCLNVDRNFMEQYGGTYLESSLDPCVTADRGAKGGGTWYRHTMAGSGAVDVYAARNGLTIRMPADDVEVGHGLIQRGCYIRFDTGVVVKVVGVTMTHIEDVFDYECIGPSPISSTEVGANKIIQIWNPHHHFDGGLDTDIAQRTMIHYNPTTNTSTREVEVEMQLFLPILQLDIPLFLFKDGIELILDLNDFKDTFVYRADVLPAGATYQITEVIYHCCMITPHPQIQDSFEQMWRSKKGITYHIPSVRVKQQSQQHDSSHTMQWHIGCRSAMKAVLKQTDSNFALTPSVDKAYSLSMNIKNYQWSVGSIYYPQQPVSMGVRGQEAYRYLLEAFDRYGSTRLYLDYYKYFSQGLPKSFPGLTNGTHLNTSQSLYTYIGVDFRRWNGYGQNLTGIDLTHVPLQCVINRSANSKDPDNFNGTVQFTLFVYYDAYLIVSNERVAVLS